MRIVVGLPSRGRPLDLIASVISLYRCASGANKVEVIIELDEDDAPSIQAATGLVDMPGRPEFRVTFLHKPRRAGLGELHNEIISVTPAESAYMMWSDRISVIAKGWDHQLAMGCLQYPNRPLWLDSVDLAGAGQIILPPAWRAACGQCFPGLFPFWFDDTAQEELDAFVHGFPRMRLEAQCAGPRGAKTNRCRDIAFWVDLFTATRPQRVEQARAVADKLGLPFHNPSAMVAMFDARDADMKRRAPELMAQFGEVGEPDASYCTAFGRAQELMDEMDRDPITGGRISDRFHPTDGFDGKPLEIEAAP